MIIMMTEAISKENTDMGKAWETCNHKQFEVIEKWSIFKRKGAIRCYSSFILVNLMPKNVEYTQGY